MSISIDVDTQLKMFDNMIELQALISEREGMIVENRWSESVGKGIQYGEAAFLINADNMRALKINAD